MLSNARMTVLIATRNGRRTLAGVLEAYTRVLAPAGGFKLVVVDNGSTDGTSELAAHFRDNRPITWLVETTPGKNAAPTNGLAGLVRATSWSSVTTTHFLSGSCLVRRGSAAHEHQAFANLRRRGAATLGGPPRNGCCAGRRRVRPPHQAPPTTEQASNVTHWVPGRTRRFRAPCSTEGHRFDPIIRPRRSALHKG